MTDATQVSLASLLTPAAEVEKRIRLFFFGEAGSLKTRSALRIAKLIGGKIAVIDLEKGTMQYRKEFQFELQKSNDLDAVLATVRLLAQGGHDYRTLIIDPITLLYRAHLEMWEDRFLAKNSTRSGHRGEWYEMNQKDWAPVKRTWESLMRMLANIDMNVIATAREKALYEKQGENLREIGRTFDGEKSLDYWFDTVLRLEHTKTAKRLAHTVKDRTGRLKSSVGGWEYAPETVFAAFESCNVGREVTGTHASGETLAAIREMAGILGMSDAALSLKMREAYGLASVDELDQTQADAVLTKLKTVAANAAKTKEEATE